MKILVTSCTRNCALTVLRSLVKNGHKVIAADDRKLPFGLHSRFVKSYELLPHEDAPNFVEELSRLVEKNQPDVILPIAGAEAICRAKNEFKFVANVLLPSFASYNTVEDKFKFLGLCNKLNVPHSRVIDRIEVAEEKLANKKLDAVVIKPRNNLGGGGGIRIVSDVNQIRDIYQNVEKDYGESFLCEYIPGPDSYNFALHVVFDANSQPICQFGFQKVRLSPPRTGVTAVAVSKRMPQLLEMVLPMLRHLKWKGPADIEFKMDAKDKQMKLIEINARFSGAVNFPISCGIDLPELTCQATLGRVVSSKNANDYLEGVKYWNPPQFLHSVFQEYVEQPSRISIFHRAFKEIKGSRVGSPYELSDPAPLLGKVLLQMMR